MPLIIELGRLGPEYRVRSCASANQPTRTEQNKGGGGGGGSHTEFRFVCVLFIYFFETGSCSPSLELVLSAIISHLIWVLGTEPRSSERAARTLNY